jgi:hypothetical protein
VALMLAGLAMALALIAWLMTHPEGGEHHATGRGHALGITGEARQWPPSSPGRNTILPRL